MRAIALTCLSLCLTTVPRAAAQSQLDGLELSWAAPDECGDSRRVRSAVSVRLGERPTARREPVEASARVERIPNGYALALRTPTGERNLEAASCEELVESAAVILALLIDPRAASAREPEPAELEPAEVPQLEAAGSNGRAQVFSGYARVEILADIGLLPNLGVGPGVALGLGLFRTSLELSGSYLPTHDVRRPDGSDVGDLRGFFARLGVCQVFLDAPSIGPCFFAEYARLTGGGNNLDPKLDVGATLWSLLLAARLSVPFSRSLRWVTELAVGLPTSTAAFTVNDLIVYETGRVVGRLRTGLELRF